MLAVDQFIIMTGGNPRGQTFTSVYWIYQNSFIFFKLGYGSALSIILMLIILGLRRAQIILPGSGRRHEQRARRAHVIRRRRAVDRRCGAQPAASRSRARASRGLAT